MVSLSHDELEVIEDHSIKDGLHSFRATFNTTFPNTNPVDLKDLTSRLLSHDGKNVVRKLIVALQSLTAALSLRSRTGNGPLFDDISSLSVQIASGTLKIESTAPLMKLVLISAEDMDIWRAVFDLIARPRLTPQPTTPPLYHPSFSSSFPQTPCGFNTGSFIDTSEYRNQVDRLLKTELMPNLRLDIPDFVPAVFGQIPQLDKLADKPTSAKEELVLEWLQDLTRYLIVWVNDRGSHSITDQQVYQGPTVYLDGSPVKRKMDVGITAHYRQSKSEDGVKERLNTPISNWGEILVTGELKSNAVLDRQSPAWLDLAIYAREVFRA